MSADSLQYGKRSSGGEKVYSFPVGASEVLKKKGGAFGKMDGSGRIEVAGAADTGIVGWIVLNEDLTASSTEGGTVLPVDLDLDGIYEIPINSGTYATTMRGEVCDLSVSSNVQGANLTASAVDVIEIVDKGFERSSGTVVSVLVKLFRNNLTRTGVV